MISRLKGGMGAFGVALIVGFNAMIGYDLLHERTETINRAREENAAMALVLERHATDSFSGVSKILAGAAEVLAVRGDSWERGDADVHALLGRQAAQRVFDAIDGVDIGEGVHHLPVRLVIRGSTIARR